MKRLWRNILLSLLYRSKEFSYRIHKYVWYLSTFTSILPLQVIFGVQRIHTLLTENPSWNWISRTTYFVISIEAVTPTVVAATQQQESFLAQCLTDSFLTPSGRQWMVAYSNFTGCSLFYTPGKGFFQWALLYAAVRRSTTATQRLSLYTRKDFLMNTRKYFFLFFLYNLFTECQMY